MKIFACNFPFRREFKDQTSASSSEIFEEELAYYELISTEKSDLVKIKPPTPGWGVHI